MAIPPVPESAASSVDYTKSQCRTSAGRRKMQSLLGVKPDANGRDESFQFMHIAEDAARHAHGEDGEVALRLVLDAARDVDDDAGVHLDFLVVEDHRALARDDVVKLVGAFVIV